MLFKSKITLLFCSFRLFILYEIKSAGVVEGALPCSLIVTKDESVVCFEDGKLQKIDKYALKFGYRWANFDKKTILWVKLQLKKDTVQKYRKEDTLFCSFFPSLSLHMIFNNKKHL